MSDAARLLLGVDGGASKTVALIADEAGTVLGAGRTGSSDIHGATGPEAAVRRVAEAVRQALAQGGLDLGRSRDEPVQVGRESSQTGQEPAQVSVGVFCLCGADWPEDDDYYRAALSRELRLPAPPIVLNDAFAALRAGTPDGIGVALVLGTGAAIAARGPSGKAWFSGFRIESAGAMELGRQVYDRLIRGTYGPGPVPGFQQAALDVFGVDSVEALVHTLSRVDSPTQQGLARLAPVLLEAGHGGDDMARSIVREHGTMLAGYVRAAALRVGLDGQGGSIVLGGGLLRHHCTDLVDAIRAGLPDWSVACATVEPAFGALLLAADEAGVRPSLERLRASGPGAAFFETL